ncbi:ABC transporter substrate-binding protein [Ktedonobacter racemifer]|uniref:Extracellular solute-binding protein family 1 n=1 Tax=Ktedonobacter racemifer DSM 44963 TaxID=485913 RepID=D6TRP0_KTERA|nr:ABC transporter substrate-binding protein [Ktedonobacter racemifer]EFH85992.1 extracellular solute-binding protein family 1 [Ktedonobacter racemifer DSM 44963]
MKKRHTFSLFFTFLLIFLLAACGGSDTGNSGGNGNSGDTHQGLTGGNSYIACPGNTSDKAANKESGTVTLTVAGWSSSPAEDALVQQNLKKFEDAHPNIKLKWSPITGDYATKMRANIASGNVPDVFYLSTDMAPEYITAGKLLDLSPYMSKSNVNAKDYYDSLITPFSCKGGQVYGLPKDWGTLGVFYNKKMFQDAGVSLPTANWTWNDMSSMAKKLTKSGNAATSTYGITLGAASQRWLPFMLADGGKVLNSDGSASAFNSQAGIDSLNFYTGFQKDGSSVQPGDVAAGWAGDAFGKKRAAMALEGPWLIPYMQQNFSDVDYDIAPVPLAPNGKRADLIFTNSWSAYASTKHPEASWELIQYMTGKDVQGSQLHAGFALPSLKSLANDSYFEQHPGFKTLFEAATYGYADNFGPHTDKIHSLLDAAVEKALLGKASPQDALKEAENKINNELNS